MISIPGKVDHGLYQIACSGISGRLEQTHRTVLLREQYFLTCVSQG